MRIAITFGLAVLLPLAGCRRDVPTAPAARSQTASRPVTAGKPSLSAADTVRRLHALRLKGQYNEMLELVTPAQRQEVLKVVLSVDELIGAELLLQEALNTQIGPGSAARFSKRREVSNILGPLSYDVDVISEEIAGDEATVLIQVAGRVPLEPVSLDRQGGAWVIDPGPPVPGLAAQLRRLAEATRDVTAEVNGGGMTAQDVYAALSLRQRPALAEIARLLAASPAVAEQKRSGE